MTSVLVGVALVLFTLPVADMESDLAPGSEADFSGRQLIVSWTPDGVVAEVAEIGQIDGMAFTVGGEATLMLGAGKLIKQQGNEVRYIETPASAPWRLSDAYEVGTGAADERLPAGRVVEVSQDGVLRARWVIDRESGLPLVTEVFDGAGELFRYAGLIEVNTDPPPNPMESTPMPEPDMMAPATPQTLPDTAGHYWRADSYTAAGDGTHSFYTDGLFSCSVFEMSRKVGPGELAPASEVEIGGHEYRRSFTPTSVVVYWQGPDQSYVLIGDLPPDHLEQVLADLPPPGRAGLLKRIWRGLFG